MFCPRTSPGRPELVFGVICRTIARRSSIGHYDLTLDRESWLRLLIDGCILAIYLLFDLFLNIQSCAWMNKEEGWHPDFFLSVLLSQLVGVLLVSCWCLVRVLFGVFCNWSFIWSTTSIQFCNSIQSEVLLLKGYGPRLRRGNEGQKRLDVVAELHWHFTRC
jgi:hypothetical protein